VQDGSKKAIFAAFVANLGIAAAKFVGFAITRSSGMLAEAAHSFADTGNQALLLFGSRRANRKADRRSPFGHGRERYFWSFIVALVLFSMGGLFALYEGIQKLSHPHETHHLGVGIAILGVAVALESFSLYTAMKEVRHVRPAGMSLWRFIRHTRSPELPVVILEDIGAEIGLVLALAGVLLSHFTGNPRWDSIASVCIGALLTAIAVILASEMKASLIGETATDEAEDRIRTAAISHPKVLKVIHLKTQHLGPDELLVGLKVEFDHSLTVRDLAVAIDGVEALVRSAEPTAVTIYLEPDIDRSGTD
jgi:divalent metal cation (Fe/Co/Zn/Cd) transporter